MEKNVAIVLAAGKGKRMGTDIPKQFLKIQDKPVLYYSLKVFQDCKDIYEIILVIGKEYQEYCQKEIIEPNGLTKVTKMVEGGAERYDSVFEGLKACGSCDYVYIHDGARPFISEEMLKRCQDSVRDEKACVVGMPVKDTIKITGEDNYIELTPPRDKVWMIQTPQVFAYDLIFQAYTKMASSNAAGITDDAMVVEVFGEHKVKLVKGSYENIKITTPDDIKVAQKFFEKI